ncbi:MAG TPA: hypothetical protein VIC06_15190 [Solirubrobacteraceae bacterium]|jgi:hypothetical protein
MAQTNRIKIKGVKRREISTEDLSYYYFLRGKEVLRQRRERAAAEKKKRQGRQQ